jgi:hypothetical protein
VPTDTVPLVFENAGLVMELFPYEVMLPGDGRSIDPADNLVPVSWMNPWLASEVAIATFPDPTSSDAPSPI